MSRPTSGQPLSRRIQLVLGSILPLTVTLPGAADAAQGRFRVHKVVVNPMGLPTPSSFALTTACLGQNWYPSDAPISNGGTSLLTPRHGSCSVVEETLSPILSTPKCQGGRASWLTTYSPAQPLALPANTVVDVTITNEITCDAGKLIVKKLVFNSLGVTTPTTFPISVVCTYSGNSATTHHVVSPSHGTPVPVIANSVCSVGEAPLPSVERVAKCPSGRASWSTAIGPSPAGPIPLNGTRVVTIQNTLKCDMPGEGGRLTVRKVVVNGTGVSSPVSFTMTAHCGNLDLPVTVHAGGAVSLAAAIPLSTTCTVSEAPLQPIMNVRACGGAPARWTTTYSPPAVISAAGPSIITVTNTLACARRDNPK